MTDVRHGRMGRQTARHEVPAIDEAALVTARWADRMLARAKDLDPSAGRPTSSRCRTDCGTTRRAALRATANRCRAAYGVKDSVRDVLPEAVTEPFLESVDRLIRELNRATA